MTGTLELVSILKLVIPAHAGIHVHRAQMDSRFRGNDEFQDEHKLVAK